MAQRVQVVALDDLPDDLLVARFQGGDDDSLRVLFARYRRFARAKARGYFLVGADSDDIEQEGLIGLYKAARDYRPDREASFRAFAELCITRQVISAVKTATRRKHQPLNQYVSISGVRGSDDAGERCVEDMLDDHRVADPAEAIVSRERMECMRRSMAEMLSGLEVDVLRLYVEGKSYHEIGLQLGRHVKSIDNALQRIKRKLQGHLAERDAAEALEARADERLLVLA
ncbi:MAG: RNA polymerase sporulation sigma factor SigH [Actinobacteria bacterium]|nr:RNA polymerase sporulation sigma factor SigH [Actinomycetota bacterium]MBW3650159.1 RNA polymerase sporulation sigma factor SigH [Actinomycetota bacterium]